MHVLIVEDDAEIATNLHDYLSSRGHIVDHAADGVTALHLAVANPYDCVVLDLALPGMDGLDVCRRLREDARRDTPILMLTARDTLEDRLKGFERGADDYLVKPFALKELEARLSALHKRHSGRMVSRVLQVGDLVYDTATLAVSRGGRNIKLPSKCLHLLEIMMQAPNRVLSRTELERMVWGERLGESDTLRSHIYLLRRALSAPGKSDYIENVHGRGYRLVVANDDAR